MDGLGLSVSNALSGLQAAQQNLSLISTNISNANTAGYSRETLPTSPNLYVGGGGVTTGLAQRQVSQSLNANLRSQISTASAASTLNTYYQSIQNLFGSLSSSSSIASTLSNFSSALQSLATTPSDTVAQQNVVSAGQALANQLNSMSSGIQTLRSDADAAIGQAVTQVNSLLQSIDSYNTQIARARANNQSTAALEDQRDQALQQLAQQMPVQAYTNADDSMVVITPQGQTLVNGSAAQLTFSPSSTITAGSTLSKITVNGIDITNDIAGGNIGALLQMRDQVLPNLTSELNQFTNQLFNTAQVATAQTQTMSGTPAVGDVLTGTIDGIPFTTSALTAGNNNAAGIAAAIQAQFANSPNIIVTATGTNTIQITDASGQPVSSSISLQSGSGTETFSAGAQSTPASSSSTQDYTMLGTPAATDTVSVTINGTTYTTAAIGAGTTSAVAAAIQAALPASVAANVKVTATSNSTIEITDTSGAPLTSSLSFSATDATLQSGVAMSAQTVTMDTSNGTPQAGDTFSVVVDGVAYTTAALTGTTTADIAAAIQAALPASVAANIKVTAPTANGSAIQFTDLSGAPISASISLASGTGAETFTSGVPYGPLPTSNTGLSGTSSDQYHFFAKVDPSAADNAATIEVNPSLVSDPSLLDGLSGSPLAQIAASLAYNISMSTPTFAAAGNFPSSASMTLGQYVGQIIGQAATAASEADDNSQYQTGVQQNLSTAAQAVSAVNMDQELANLTVYQTAYAASARVLQTVSAMFTALLQS